MANQNIINGLLKNISKFKLQNQLPYDYIPNKYIENLSKKLKYNGKFSLKASNKKYMFFVSLFKDLFIN